MKILLILTAVIEVVTGLALVAWPSAPITILLGSSLDTATGLTVGRIAGAALLALGVACWLARDDGQSRAGMGLLAAMLLYNIAVVAVLVSAGIHSGLVGVALWPAVVLHAALAACCIASLWRKQLNAGDRKRA